MKYSSYQHIERFGREEVEGIELGDCYVYPKIDGTNAVLFMGDDGEIKAGSRTRQLSLGSDNAGFYSAVLDQGQFKGVKELLKANPNFIVFGEWLCLSGDTIIRKASGGKNSNYMTLREMYKYSITPINEKQQYISKKTGTNIFSMREPWWVRYGYPSLFSLYQDEDKIRPNKMKKIIYTGDKPVYEITTRKGYKIKSSKEHPFLTPDGFRALETLKINDCVAISALRTTRNKKRTYGKGTNKIFQLQQKYKDKIGKCEICGLATCLELHHKDGDHTNNIKSNYQVLCTTCHRNLEGQKFEGCEYEYEFDKIISINFIGIEDCYDISMEGTENEANFVAQGFIVHNCPHTLKTYKDDAWRKFYLFDILAINADVGRYISYDEYEPLCKQYDINYIPCLAKIHNGSYEQFIHVMNQNNYLVQDGAGLGEGIVIKNYAYRNKFGRQTWTKIVSSEFKEKHIKEMGPNEIDNKMTEDGIVAKYLTEAMIEKIKAKIINEAGEWNNKFINRLIETSFHDLVVEELWTIIKDLKQPTINFKTFRYFVVLKVKTFLGL